MKAGAGVISRASSLHVCVLAVAVVWDTHMCPLQVAWGFLQHGDSLSRVSIPRETGVFDLALEVIRHRFLHNYKPSQIQEAGAKASHLPITL